MNSALALTLDEFGTKIAQSDFQRSNMFSMHFATRPSAKSQKYIGLMTQSDNSASIAGTLRQLGVSNSNIQNAITSIINIGTQKVIRKAGVQKILIGAMTNRLVQSLLGELNVGTYLLEYFDSAFPTSGLMVQAVKIPDSHLNYDMDKQHNAPIVKVTGRDYEPLVITFRMDSEASNYRAFVDWVNSVEDPVTGLRGLSIDVESDIQINLHKRNGYPHTAYVFGGCIPMIVSGPQISYEDNNQITVFDVTFAYRTMSVGAIGETAAKEWVEQTIITGSRASTADTNMNINRLART